MNENERLEKGNKMGGWVVSQAGLGLRDCLGESPKSQSSFLFLKFGPLDA